MEEILNSKVEPQPGEEKLASLTALERTKWAQARNAHFNRGIMHKPKLFILLTL